MTKIKRLVILFVLVVMTLTTAAACRPRDDEDISVNAGGKGSALRNDDTADTDADSGQTDTAGDKPAADAGDTDNADADTGAADSAKKPDGHKTDTDAKDAGNTNGEKPDTVIKNSDDTDGGNTGGDDPGGDGREYSTSCMSFNVLAYDTHDVGYDEPRVRINYIEKTIKKYDPDLIGTQELMGPVAKNDNFDSVGELIKRLSSAYDYCCALDDKGFPLPALNISNGFVIFYKKGRFEVKDRGCKAFNSVKNKCYHWVKFYDKQEKVTFLMTNTHFSSNYSVDPDSAPMIRDRQAAELLAFWKKKCGEKVPLFATGDYNHQKKEQAYATLSSANFVSSRDVAENNSGNSGVDYIYINGNVQGCHKYYKVEDTFEPAGVPDTGLAKYKASDHNAIIAYCYYDL